MPQEPLCVENLQPFLNILPNRGVTGLASMIMPEAIHRSEYYAMQIRFTSTDTQASFQASIFLVNDLNRWNRNGSKSNLSLLTFKLTFIFFLEYSLQSVLGKLPIDPSGQLNLFGKEIDLKAFDKIEYTLPTSFAPYRPVRVQSFKTGTGDDEAGFGYVLHNSSEEKVTIKILQPIPWMFRPLWHQATRISALNALHLTTAKFDRKSSSFAELVFTVPANSQIRYHIPFEREFLRIDEFPANSERGIDLPAAKLIIGEESFASNVLLYTWPIPDATMPFNIITMSSTVMALFYGAFFNMIFRRFYLRRPEDPPASPVGRIVWNIKQKIRQLKANRK